MYYIHRLKHKRKKTPDSLLPYEAEILKYVEISARQNTKWSEQDHKQFVEGLKTFGKDFQKIADSIGTEKTAEQVRFHAHSIVERIKKNKSDPEADLLPILQQGKHWSNAEIEKFKEGLQLFGKDFKKLVQHLGTGRTPEQLRS